MYEKILPETTLQIFAFSKIISILKQSIDGFNRVVLFFRQSANNNSWAAAKYIFST